MTADHGPLTGLRVLVTRPAHQARPLLDALASAGAEPVSFPTLEIQPIVAGDDAHQQTKHRFLNLDRYRCVIFVSANAARQGYEWIDHYWPQLPVGIRWLAVGQATARTLLELGIEVTQPGHSMNTEALLELPELQQVEHQHILICRGEGGRETLADRLRSRGATVDYAELYRRTSPAYASQDIESIIYNFLPSVILVTSNDSLQNLDQICRGRQRTLPIEQLHRIPVIVPSQRVAECASHQGYDRVFVADNATDEAMLQAIQDNIQPTTADEKHGKVHE